MILTIRTDKPEAEIGLFNDSIEIGYKKWPAHRELSQTIHNQIGALLKQNGKSWQDITGVVCFKGPGSFTGLRIGLSVANALAGSLSVPLSGTNGPNWIHRGLSDLQKGPTQQVVLPDYGAPAKTTKPKA